MKLVLDLDVGVDDTLAVCEALANPAFDLIAVTASFGNVTQAESQENALAVLELLGATDVPVFPGADRALDADAPYEPDAHVRTIHGPHGLGDWNPPVPARKPEEESAVDALIRLCHSHGPDLAIVTTASLTNLALAIRKDPEAIALAGSVTVMGGAVACEGNVSPVAEANISDDPLAAQKVLASGIPLTLVGLDVTMQAILPKCELEQWRTAGPVGRALARICGFYVGSYESRIPGIGGCPLHDPLAVAIAADPSLATLMPMTLTCEPDSPLAGRITQPLASLPQEDKRPHRVALALDRNRAVASMVNHFAAFAEADFTR